MVFNSIEFIVFFFSVLGLYYFLSKKGKLVWIFLASCYFYMVFVPKYILILFFLILVDYAMGIAIEKHRDRERKFFLLISLTANLLVLFIFKYFNFFAANVSYLAQFLHWNYSPVLLQVALPIGLSFHVFQSLSYVIEVYLGKQKAEKNLGIYAMYVMFFPQLVAGPIERPQELLPQLHADHPFVRANLTRGFELMLLGFFKKLVIADNIALIVNHTYKNLPAMDGPTLVLTILLFSYQLYCDFSGYTDIALGTALSLGYNLTNNFDRPYASKSVPEFWRRWHISLSSWLRDYLYYPLVFTGKAIGRFRLYIATLVTFILIGLWHGANWTFVFLGLSHAVYLISSSIKDGFRLPKIPAFLRVSVTFILVSLSWVFFRAASLSAAFYILGHIFHGWAWGYAYWRYKLLTISNLGVSKAELLVIFAAIGLLELVQYRQALQNTLHVFEGKAKILRLGWYYSLALAILFFGYFAAPSFIYFQF